MKIAATITATVILILLAAAVWWLPDGGSAVVDPEVRLGTAIVVTRDEPVPVEVTVPTDVVPPVVQQAPPTPVAAVETPVIEPQVVSPSVPASVPPVSTVCEVAHSGQHWAAYGKTDHPNGTTFTFRVTADGVVTDYPMVAHQGSVMVAGVTYGGGGYPPGMSGVFGFTQADMPVVVGDSVSAVVLLGADTLC